jgi:chromosome partitioning protein
MKIISFLHTKGGAGKTTTLVNLAAEASRDPANKVVIVDLDVGRNASSWILIRNKKINENGLGVRKIDLIQSNPHTAENSLISCEQNNYTHVFVDVPGVDSSELKLAVIYADLVIVPTDPADYTFERLVRVNEIVAQANYSKGKSTPVYLLPTRLNTHRDVLLQDLTKFDKKGNTYSNMIKTNSFLGRRRNFEKTASEGGGVTEIYKDSEAAVDLAKVYKEIFGDKC